MIEQIREYISKCPYLDKYSQVRINYLSNKINAYSVNEMPEYNPVIDEDIDGSKTMQFLFYFDAKFHWNEEIKNNLDNSIFFEKVKDWLEENNSKGIYPKFNNIEVTYIGATSNGYIFATNADEAIYRIPCKMEYYKEGDEL